MSDLGSLYENSFVRIYKEHMKCIKQRIKGIPLVNIILTCTLSPIMSSTQ